MAACPRTFEPVPDNRRWSTHTCARLAGHHGPHVCPDCGQQWLSRPGIGPNQLLARL